MRIVPYRVLFEVDLDSVSEKGEKYRYSKPTEKKLDVEPKEDENGIYYQVQTHDRGDGESGQFYQIAFRIEDPSPYRIEELSLHLDSSLYRNSGQQINNDLFCPPAIKNDPKKNLWYQLSTYAYKKEKWVPLNEKDKPEKLVDCITTAGVFRVIVKRNGIVLSQYNQPWVYVLPSSISKADYIKMLNDLIRLSEGLVQKNSHTTGIGEKTAIERETNQIKQEIEITRTFVNSVEKIMQLPSELQGKRYVKKNIQKIHRFDGRVIQDYIYHGMSGKVKGIEYFEDHDTYENRIIKYVLEKLIKISLPNYDEDVEIDIDKKKNEIFEKLTAETPKESTRSVKLAFHGIEPYNDNFTLSICVNGNAVIMKSHHAFEKNESKEKIRYRLAYYAKTRSELLFYLQHLIDCYDGIMKKEQTNFNIDCVLKHEQESFPGNTQYKELILSDCKEINEESITYQDISDAEYNQRLLELCKFQPFELTINPKPFENREPQIIKYSPKREREEEQRMKDEIKHKLEDRQDRARHLQNLKIEYDKLKELKKGIWFQDIMLPQEVHEVRPSAKFINNQYYAEIYKLICQMYEIHPHLAASFEANAFGVYSTEQVYEYWVFIKLLTELENIGFVINDEKKKELKQCFKNFLDQRKRPEGFNITAVHCNSNNPIEITIGFNQEFKSPGKKRTPDCYICINHGNKRNWYFIDAKYKSFTRGNGLNDRKNYLQEIYDISIEKYIIEMKEILNGDPNYKNFKNDIRGSYIAMAYSDDGNTPLSENNRLFGGKTSIFEETSVYKHDIGIQRDIDNSSRGLPGHRYGAIVLTPSHDEEIKSLLRLIFEYLESDKSGNGENNAIFHQCWDCGSNTVDRKKVPIRKNDDKENSFKYWTTCTHCKAFRVDTHCVNAKMDLSHFG